MNDTTDSAADHHDSTTDPTDVGLSVNEAPARLGITPDAVRARIHRGTLRAVKQGNLWTVSPSDTTRHDDHRPSPRHTTTDPTAAQGSDLAPLTALLADVMKQNADLAATAAVWQDRAAHLEERLRQLEAGERHSATVSEPETRPVDTYRAPGSTAPVGVLARLREWLKGQG